MKVFLNVDCTTTALFGQFLHYEASPGRWEDVDLTLEPEGNGYAMDEHDLEVVVLGTSVEVTHRDTGEGIAVSTPAVPEVAGRSATFTDDGMTWRYTTRTTGIKLEADVTVGRSRRPTSSPISW